MIATNDHNDSFLCVSFIFVWRKRIVYCRRWYRANWSKWCRIICVRTTRGFNSISVIFSDLNRYTVRHYLLPGFHAANSFYALRRQDTEDSHQSSTVTEERYRRHFLTTSH